MTSLADAPAGTVLTPAARLQRLLRARRHVPRGVRVAVLAVLALPASSAAIFCCGLLTSIGGDRLREGYEQGVPIATTLVDVLVGGSLVAAGCVALVAPAVLVGAANRLLGGHFWTASGAIIATMTCLFVPLALICDAWG